VNFVLRKYLIFRNSSFRRKIAIAISSSDVDLSKTELVFRLPITTGSGQTNTTILQSLSIIRKLQNDRFDLCISHPLSNKYSYTHSAGLMQPARAKFNLHLCYTVIPLSRANYPTNYGFIHTMNPTQPTARLN